MRTWPPEHMSTMHPPSRLRSPFVHRDAPKQQQCCSTRRKVVSQSQRRRRHIPRRERVAHPFDQLPWIHLLEQEPQHNIDDPWDIADLSRVVPDENQGPGPVRSRKSSLRTNPLASPPLLPCLPVSSAPPVTPKSKPHLPSRVLFRNLMPVSPSSPNCIDFHSLEL